MSVVLTNNAVSKLASSLTSGATTLSVTSGEGSKFPSPSVGEWFPITLIKTSGALEIVRCTSRSGDVFTVTRAQEGTSAQAFAAGDRAELRLTAAAFTEPLAQLEADIDAAQADIDAFVASSVSFRNKLINGNFQVNQRAYVSGTATTGANQYTMDRWRVVTSGQNLAFSASGNGNEATTPAGGLEQVIEGANIEGGVYTLSWSGTATATVNGAAITNGGQTSSLTAGANVTVKFASGTVSKAQFEFGSNATLFEERPIGLETSLCMRYFQRLSNYIREVAYYAGSTGVAIVGIADQNLRRTWRGPGSGR